MESDSQPGSPLRRSPVRFAEVVGTLIAIATLALPTFIVAHYSSRPNTTLVPPYSITRLRER